jgi:hypothetical protein
MASGLESDPAWGMASDKASGKALGTELGMEWDKEWDRALAHGDGGGGGGVAACSFPPMLDQRLHRHQHQFRLRR